MRVDGSKNVYGAAVGILMLRTRFPRIPGDVGNALTWPFPVLYRTVQEASPDRVVRRRGEGLEDAFVEAARELVALGADGIVSNCGFLSLFQARLAATAGVPVAASSLMQIPWIERLLPEGRRAGVLTISAASLTPEHLAAAGARTDTPVFGTDGGSEFTRAILNDEPSLDVERARNDILEAAAALVARHQDLGAIVLECTNMVPFAADIRRAVGLPVFSMYNLVLWFQQGLAPRRFPLDLDDTRANSVSGPVRASDQATLQERTW